VNKVEQLTIFNVNEIDKKINSFTQLIDKNQYPFDLVAVNKMYNFSAIVYDRTEKQLYYVLLLNEKLRKDYSITREFGPNYYVVDERFSDYESVRLRKGKHYTTCAKRDLERFISDGWEVGVS
jgi:hypothetical protein